MESKYTAQKITDITKREKSKLPTTNYQMEKQGKLGRYIKNGTNIPILKENEQLVSSQQLDSNDISESGIKKYVNRTRSLQKMKNECKWRWRESMNKRIEKERD